MIWILDEMFWRFWFLIVWIVLTPADGRISFDLSMDTEKDGR